MVKLYGLGDTYTGEIGKQLEYCETFPVQKFAAIKTEMPQVSEETKRNLSTDQKYLYNIVVAVETEHVSEKLANLRPGKMAHSRWLTTANRVMRLYVSVEDLSETLKTFSNCNSTVYAPGWFNIKMNPEAIRCLENLHKILQLCGELSENVLAIIKPVGQKNTYFAHPENILIAMVSDNQPHVRELGWRRILKARRKGCNGVRRFKIPQLTYASASYIGIIDWQANDITKPPLTKELTDAEIESHTSEKMTISFPALPCHTQAVERMITLLTAAAQKVVG